MRNPLPPLTLLLLPLSLLYVEPAVDVHAPDTVVFIGTVTDRDTGRPLSGAQVVLEGGSHGGVTDSLGHYGFESRNLKMGSRVRLEAQMLGYRSGTQTITVQTDSVRVDFQLESDVTQMEAITTAQSGNVSRARFAAGPPGSYYPPGYNTESYDHIEEEGFRSPLVHPLSTFAADVDRASYANVRRFLTGGELPPVDAIRIEELVNYFDYEDPLPKDGRPFAVTTEVAPAPWRPAHRLVRIGLRAPAVELSELPPGNLVFLIDVSGSMTPPNKLPLVKQSLTMLIQRLRAEDRISMAVYAGAAGTVLEGARGDETARILAALDGLEAGGSTAGGEGLRLAYRVAAEHHMPGANNRVILVTDGDFNVGVSSDSEMQRLVEERRAQGTFLTVIGVGAGNTKFSKMEKMADHGNGQFHYIDGLLEAKKALVEEMGGTLLTVAKDVKLQVEFNPERVAGYRLIGYENRRLDPEDFDDDKKDAGEIGAGHSVVAFYEIVPHGADTDVVISMPDSLRYQRRLPAGNRNGSDGEIGFLKVRYKSPDGERSELLTFPILDEGRSTSPAFQFGSAVVEFGLVLRDSPFRGEAELGRAQERAKGALGPDQEGYRSEFIRLVDLARELERNLASASDGPGE